MGIHLLECKSVPNVIAVDFHLKEIRVVSIRSAWSSLQRKLIQAVIWIVMNSATVRKKTVRNRASVFLEQG